MTHTQLLIALVSASVLFSTATSVAVAQQPVAGEEGPTQPFLTLDRPSTVSSTGVDISFSFFTNESNFALRLDPHFEYVFDRQIGIMATLPTAALLTDGENHAALGALDVGGFYIVPLGPQADLILRGSLALPTAGDDFADVITNLFGSYARLADLVLIVPNMVVARTAASLVARFPSLTLRADLGFDTPLVATEGEISDRTPIGHLSAGAAVGADRTKFIGELVNVFAADSASEDFISQLGAGVSHQVGRGAIKGGVSVFVDGLFEDDDEDLISLNFSYTSAF